MTWSYEYELRVVELVQVGDLDSARLSASQARAHIGGGRVGSGSGRDVRAAGALHARRGRLGPRRPAASGQLVHELVVLGHKPVEARNATLRNHTHSHAHTRPVAQHIYRPPSMMLSTAGRYRPVPRMILFPRPLPSSSPRGIL